MDHDEDIPDLPMKGRIIMLIFDFIQKLSGYLLMLLAMTFNGWVLLTICFGLTLGYILTNSM